MYPQLTSLQPGVLQIRESQREKRENDSGFLALWQGGGGEGRQVVLLGASAHLLWPETFLVLNRFLMLCLFFFFSFASLQFLFCLWPEVARALSGPILQRRPGLALLCICPLSEVMQEKVLWVRGWKGVRAGVWGQAGDLSGERELRPTLGRELVWASNQERISPPCSPNASWHRRNPCLGFGRRESNPRSGTSSAS